MAASALRPSQEEMTFTLTPSDTKAALGSTSKRTPSVPLDQVPGKLPEVQLPVDVDVEAVASEGVARLATLKQDHLTTGAIWRDLYALTGLPRTLIGRDRLFTAWKDLNPVQRPADFSLIPGSARVMRLSTDIAWVSASFTFSTSGTPETLCSGTIGLIPDSDTKGTWKIWLLTTVLERLKDFTSPDSLPATLANGNIYTGDRSGESEPYECVVIGAGFAGLCLSARLHALHVRYITLEKNERVGDNWRQRYESATFHTGRPMSDFPLGGVFTEDDPYYLNQKDLARGYETFAQKHHLNLQNNSTLRTASWDEDGKLWTLRILYGSRETEIQTRHFVLAIGGAGQTPKMPHLADKEKFKGTAVHSARYKSSKGFAGKKGVVVGTANTGHDVAEDMLAEGLSSVTMVQRGATRTLMFIFFQQVNINVLFSQNKDMPIEVSDRGAMGLPNVIIRQMNRLGYKTLSSQEPNRYDALEKAGFRIDRNVDIWKILCGKQGGHYVDVGTSKKIGDGLIKIKNDSSLVYFDETGLAFSNGSRLDADLVVFCTGFENDVREQAVSIVGPRTGELLDDYFDTDEEGEIIGAWRPHRQQGIWYTGGGAHLGRFFSRFLALQIKADVVGTPLSVYKQETFIK
ncbi:uncharacterized protein PV06_09466 [Exophiala oligosperma]|uniref:FAD/NAD(P)-binding domain-containing protein n=1 Tax=Exophiala oligosperma TaxID=215243 RepID=A0A0D2D806_9EURO|nr:uncharacterized protein PV06_09466 [Exophiala oligosperma]KIW38510.1 hypothetical protein PV06_09466 [Exophiala oligosperma]